MKRSFWTQIRTLGTTTSMVKPSLVERSRMVAPTMGSQAMVSSEAAADNGATKENALEETNTLGGNPIPNIKKGTRDGSPSKGARATTKKKGTQEDN